MLTIAPTQTLPIVETFHSVQGEGVWTGVSTFFIRLAGCDVGCPWCDTKHSWSTKRYPQQTIETLVKQATAVNPQMVVITGGEPLMHDLSKLSKNLQKSGLRTHLETSGAHPFSGKFDWVSFSPKQFKRPHQSIYPRVNELKVVVSDARDLEWAEVQAEQVPKDAVKLLQPEWNSPDSSSLIFDYVLKHPNWRISLQTHKFLGVR